MEQLENTSLDFAIANMQHFMAELIETFGKLDWQYVGLGDKPRHKSGWYSFEIVLDNEIVAIDMPGSNPALFSPTADMLAAPEIYVNGSSWQYGYALSHTDDEIRNIIVDQWIRKNKLQQGTKAATQAD
jgi:hypothetical protein